ncbi:MULTISPECIES: hypothetical protein [Nonomuraea]|uniref:Uncharacterized protein n=1 Tax=Nonomuraea mangrovi TaxID=2316207 RepID=A0ABW4T252_9ACTN
MLRRILVGAAIATTVFAGTAAHADNYTKPEKGDNECNNSNVAAGGLIGGVLSNILTFQNSPLTVNLLANNQQEFEWCED